MANISQIQKAAVKFLDNDVAGAFESWDKTMVCGTGALFVFGIPRIIKAYENHPIVQMAVAVGAYDPVNGMVDVDLLYKTYEPWFCNDKFPVKIPVINKTIRVGKEEIDKFVKYIKEA